MKKITYLLVCIPILAIGQLRQTGLNKYASIPITSDLQKENSIVVYPNPVKSTLYLNYKASVSIKKIELYDILGKKINELFSDYRTINMSQYIKGVYLLKIETSKQGTITKKL